MKNSEIRELSTPELVERIDSEKEFQVRQRLNHAISPLDNPMKIRDSRRTIARLQTELRRRLAEEKQAVDAPKDEDKGDQSALQQEK